MALSPKESGEFISKTSQHVSIKDAGVDVLAQEVMRELANNNIHMNMICEHECYPNSVTTEEAVDWICFIDTINFCFWTPGPGKWDVSYKGKLYTGYFALCAAVAKAIDEGVDLINPKVYSKLTLGELAHILRSESKKEIPLLEERLDCLHQVGKILLDKYEGTFVNCIKACNKSAQALLKLITSEFECFNDTASYKGKIVSFHKRAQILVADVWSQFSGKGYGEFTDIETITMFADYRVPQPLVHFKAMEYSDTLWKLLESNEIMESGCENEAEIRGCSIEVVERVKKRVDELMGKQGKKYICNSILIDNFLWMYRRKHAIELDYIPFHKVASIYY